MKTFYDDDSVLDFINSIKVPGVRTTILKMIDSVNEDLEIVMKHHTLDTGLVDYYVIFKSTHEDNGGLMMFVAESPDEMLGFLRSILRQMPPYYRADFALRVESIYLGLLNLENYEDYGEEE